MSDTIKFPAPPKTPPQLRYAILRHEGMGPAHFDLMFAVDPHGALATWRSDAWPILAPTPIVKIADHRRDFLTYEGPLTCNRGHVIRVVSGYYRLDRPDPATWRLTFRDYVGFAKLEFRRDDTRQAAPPLATASGSIQEPWTARPLS